MGRAVKLKEKLRQVRKQKRMNQAEVAAIIGISRRSYGLYELGKTTPDAVRLSLMAQLFEVSVDWLLSEDAALMAEDTEPRLPMLGLASCSVAGWFQPEEKRGMSVALPGADLVGGFVVTATGPSLVPEGIKPGYMCYCAPSLEAQVGDIVYIKEKSGVASMKVYRGESDGWLIVDGYFPPNSEGVQVRYTEKRPRGEVVQIVPVIYVRRK